MVLNEISVKNETKKYSKISSLTPSQIIINPIFIVAQKKP